MADQEEFAAKALAVKINAATGTRPTALAKMLTLVERARRITLKMTDPNEFKRQERRLNNLLEKHYLRHGTMFYKTWKAPRSAKQSEKCKPYKKVTA